MNSHITSKIYQLEMMLCWDENGLSVKYGMHKGKKGITKKCIMANSF